MKVDFICKLQKENCATESHNLQVLHIFDLWGQVLEVIVAQVQGAKGFWKVKSMSKHAQQVSSTILTKLEEISWQNIFIQVVVRQIQHLEHRESTEAAKNKEKLIANIQRHKLPLKRWI